MSQDYTSLGLMSGTSGDGVDASIIRSDGKSNYEGQEWQIRFVRSTERHIYFE